MNIDNMTIQLASPSDAASLANLSERTFRDAFEKLNKKDDFENYVAGAFTETKIKSEIRDTASTFFIAILNDQWVGYAKLHHSRPPECVKQRPAIELSRLYAMQQYCGYGIGTALVKTCVDFARKNTYKAIWLGSWKKNHKGNKFYTKMQFDIVGTKIFALGSDIQEDHVFRKSLNSRLRTADEIS